MFHRRCWLFTTLTRARRTWKWKPADDSAFIHSINYTDKRQNIIIIYSLWTRLLLPVACTKLSCIFAVSEFTTLNQQISRNLHSCRIDGVTASRHRLSIEQFTLFSLSFQFDFGCLPLRHCVQFSLATLIVFVHVRFTARGIRPSK